MSRPHYRRRPKTGVDQNQEPIVRILRAVGATVQSLASVGDGCPDLLVGFRRSSYLLEVKREFVPGDASMRRKDVALRATQEAWHRVWRGLPVAVVHTPAEALMAIGAASEAKLAALLRLDLGATP